MSVYTQDYLDKLVEAYGALMRGESVRELTDENGEKVTYTAANRRDLKNHIAEVRRYLAGAAEDVVGPAEVYF